MGATGALSVRWDGWRTRNGVLRTIDCFAAPDDPLPAPEPAPIGTPSSFPSNGAVVRVRGRPSNAADERVVVGRRDSGCRKWRASPAKTALRDRVVRVVIQTFALLAFEIDVIWVGGVVLSNTPTATHNGDSSTVVHRRRTRHRASTLHRTVQNKSFESRIGRPSDDIVIERVQNNRQDVTLPCDITHFSLARFCSNRHHTTVPAVLPARTHLLPDSPPHPCHMPVRRTPRLWTHLHTNRLACNHTPPSTSRPRLRSTSEHHPRVPRALCWGISPRAKGAQAGDG